MLTPRFTCSQTDSSVIISVYVPSVRASDVEIHVESCLFSLHINPYFLRLKLPKPVLEDDESLAQYDPSTGYLIVTLSKETPGEDFEDLDLLSKLLAPNYKPKEDKHPVIEVIDSKDNHEREISQLVKDTEKLDLKREHEIFLEAAKNDWQLPQHLPEDLPGFSTTTQQSYGFLDMHSGYFRHITHTENEVNDLGPDAEILGEDERRKMGEQRVKEKFDEDYYLADFMNDEEIQSLVQWQRPGPESSEFTEDEKLIMLHLPRKEYLSTPPQTQTLYLTLITLLFSSVYDTRTTLSDPTSESAWTISILTPAFASLSPPPPTASLQEALIPTYKRALSFPLYRSFALCERCKLDVSTILEGGRRAVLKVLLGMKGILDRHDVYYVYSKIWVEDFCVWVQSQASDEALRTLSGKLRTSVIQKRMLGWGLDEVELAAKEMLERESDSDDEDENEIERMVPTVL